MTGTMLAGRMNFATTTFAVTEVAIPSPGPGEVRVRVRAAGVCLSDVHLVQGLLKPHLLAGDEVTLGHEVAGEVDSTGPGVTGVSPGHRVIVGAVRLVGEMVRTMGVDYDGGWAEYVVAPADLLVPIPDSLPFEQAAIIPDAVSTPWAAIESTARVVAGESVAVWGVGGLGAHAVQLLRFGGAAPIIAVDPQRRARERALEFGADVALDPADPDFATKVLDATEGVGIAVGLDFAGVAQVRSQAVKSLAPGGRLVLVGISGGPLTIGNDTMFAYRRAQILGHYGSDHRHVAQLVGLIGLGRIDLSRSITGAYALADAARAVEALESKQENPIRLILVP
jgi:D-arabinose 1-dehydrogenase-like Zn-dependent alcohol dehydrogenase